MKTWFGDIHTHSTFSDGKNHPEHLMERAQGNLDFYAFTDHAQLPDTVSWGPDQFPGWGFIVQPLGERWGEIQQMIRDNHEPGRFVTFLGYEWSSRQWGDHNVYYLNDHEPIRYARSLAELYAALRGVEAMAFPHHTAYPRHNRGYDWAGFDTNLAPVTEIYSHHGSSETQCRYRKFNGSVMGPRCQSGTIQRALDLSYVVGIIASSDDHQGWPGSHGMGLVAVQAEELTRKSIWDAIWKRRTYGITGDRILLDFNMDGMPMGGVATLAKDRPRNFSLKVNGWDCLKSIEIVRNGRVAKTWTEFCNAAADGMTRYKVAVEWGYHGGQDREWNIAVEATGGRITNYNYYFGMPGHDRHQLKDERSVELHSTTAAHSGPQGHDSRTYGGIKEVDLEIDGDRDTILAVLLDGKKTLRHTLGEIMEESRCAMPFGPYSGAIQLMRCVPESRYLAELEWEDDPMPGTRQDYYYVRVTQDNDQMAWSSPIWVRTA